MAPRTLPSPGELTAQRTSGAPDGTPVLPEEWTAQVLLTPFGDTGSPLTNYSQLVVADVAYDGPLRAMRVSLYLTQDLTYFDFLFLDGGWYWLVSTPGSAPTDWYGPFATPLAPPAPDFLAAMGARYGNTWPIMGVRCHGWVIPTPSSDPPDHGSWYSFRAEDGQPFRIFTFDDDNPCGIPILGSYYLANIPTFQAGASDALRALVPRVRAGRPDPVRDYSNPLVTQRDIQSAMANPLASAPCTAQQIETLIPGFVADPGGSLPEWTDQTFIEGMTIGTDFIPYYTAVYYWYSYGKQQSIFIGCGLTPGQGSYGDRQDNCLFNDPPHTDIPQYVAANDEWVPRCCAGTLDGIGVPRPDFVAATNGRIMASITGNADFGLGPDQQLNLIACPFMRGPGEAALFWVWFLADQTGVLFTEANFVDSTDHSLQLIDYVIFERNATWLDPDIFTDPCPGLSPCPGTPDAESAARARGALVPHGAVE